MAKYRRERVSESIKEIVAKELATFRDPRLQFLTVTDVRVSGDLKLARVYWSMLVDVNAPSVVGPEIQSSNADSSHNDGQVDDANRALRGASRAIRACLARELSLRVVPQIEFIFDDSAIYGAKIDRLLSKLAS